jgi:hypothetical protein
VAYYAFPSTCYLGKTIKFLQQIFQSFNTIYILCVCVYVYIYPRSSFKKFPQFAGKIHRKSFVKCREITNVNKEMYTGILRRLRDAIRRKFPGKWRTNSWFLLRDNVPAHRLVLWRILNKEQCDIIGASPLLSWTGCTWFLPFPSIEIGVERDSAFVMLLTSIGMRRKSWKGFQECFQHLYSRWQNCIFAKGDYFESHVA